MHTLINLLRQLGFAINWSKVEGPSQQLVFLGVVVDSASMTLALPTLKLKDFSDLLTMFLKKKRVSVRQLETLVGKLSWASQVICGGRTFLRRVLDLKNSVKERHHKVLLTNAFFADLQWWILFMETFNGTCRIQDPRPISSLQTDASSEGGGGFYNGDYFYINWALDLPVCATEHINVKEFVAIFLAVFRWCNNFLNKKVIIYSDNASAVSWINKGTSRNPLIQFMCRILFWISAMNNCAFSARYIPGGFTVQMLQDQASDLKRKAWASSTAATYRTHMKSYMDFCDQISVPPLPATSETLQLYVTYLAKVKCFKFCSIQQYLNIIPHMHKLCDLPDPIPQDYQLKYLLMGVKRELGTAQSLVDTVTPSHLLRI
uniref:Uncharacterized protein LOC111106975 isoform X1 n=1 Tax=Crassostrea virginica TaxID=6565 RepID=A0A8B8B4J2_CRAVI|nr:uncharacterized protein LOC111106975 isoform X1 [Crassostrea virginica]